jgi:hypothetical protein
LLLAERLLLILLVGGAIRLHPSLGRDSIEFLTVQLVNPPLCILSTPCKPNEASEGPVCRMPLQNRVLFGLALAWLDWG